MSGILKTVYRFYGGSRKNIVGKFHLKFLGSPLMARWIFGLKKFPVPKPKRAYFDLTTILLKMELKELVRPLKDPQILEIGLGNYAILSGWLSKYVKQTIDAVDLNQSIIDCARSYVEANGFNLNPFQSDLFTNVPDKKYDLIFWNLPYYRDPVFLDGLFEQAPNYMTDEGKLCIGYNPTPLPRATVLKYLERHVGLRMDRVITYWWNLHEIVLLKKCGR